MIANWYFCYR